MPELPDIEAYAAALRPRMVGSTLTRIRIVGPFVLRTFDPPVEAMEGARIGGIARLGKRVVFELDGDRFVVVHLMIAGRFRWIEPGGRLPAKIALAAFDTPAGTLCITEAGSKKRASIHLVAGRGALAAHDRGGIEPLSCSLDAFASALARENHTLKRALTDPRMFAGIGNAYSDEILHAARLSPIVWTTRLADDDIARLYEATRDVLARWTTTLTGRYLKKFPGAGDVTAFRNEFAVHGKFGKPCPVCRAPVQRIRYADNETNYCARCQTGGKVLADRSLSRLLKDDWPRRIEELEGN